MNENKIRKNFKILFTVIDSIVKVFMASNHAPSPLSAISTFTISNSQALYLFILPCRSSGFGENLFLNTKISRKFLRKNTARELDGKVRQQVAYARDRDTHTHGRRELSFPY